MADEEELLKILEEHGKRFLSSFALPSSLPSQKRRRTSNEKEEEEEEEWHGIQMSSSEEMETENNFEQSDDDFVADSSNVVVFSDPTSKIRHDPLSKAHMKAFMSSRVSKLTSDPLKITETRGQEESDEERSNAQNDALLHRLVHTKLLSGSLSADLDLNSAQRKKALAGRVLELAGTAKLGKGENAVIEAERRRASKRVREGLASKQKQREKQRLEEAKNLGNYHPAIKHAFGASLKTKALGSRDRGLRLGVGRFKDGVLTLSKEDINKVEGIANNDRRRRVHHGQGR